MLYFAAGHFINHIGYSTRSSRTGSDFNSIGAALRMFHTNAHRYPTTQEGLQALVRRPATLKSSRHWEPILDSVPKDAWQRDYQYILGSESTVGFGLYSLGPNGTLDLGDGPSDDIFSWEEEPTTMEAHRRRPWTFHLTSGILIGILITRIFTGLRGLLKTPDTAI